MRSSPIQSSLWCAEKSELPGVWWVRVQILRGPFLWSKYKSKSTMKTGCQKHFYILSWHLLINRTENTAFILCHNGTLCFYFYFYFFWGGGGAKKSLINFHPKFIHSTGSQAIGIVRMGSKVTGFAETGSKTRSGISRKLGLWSFPTFYHGIINFRWENTAFMLQHDSSLSCVYFWLFILCSNELIHLRHFVKNWKNSISKVTMRLQRSFHACHQFDRNTAYRKKALCVCDERYLILYDVCINQVYSRLCH